MNTILRSALAVAAITAATPSLAWTVWPDVDFEWYANVGRTDTAATQSYPAPRAGYIWSPGHYEWTGTRHLAVPGAWITDDYDRQWHAYARADTLVYTNGPLELIDRDGNVIPIAAADYPVDSAIR